MKVSLPEGAGFSDLARALAGKSSEIEDMYLVVPFRVNEKSLEVVDDDVHVMVIGKDGTETEIEMREHEGRMMLSCKALAPEAPNIIPEGNVTEQKP
jgi:hypothetical protein